VAEMLASSSSRKKKLVAVSFRQSDLPYASFRYNLTAMLASVTT